MAKTKTSQRFRTSHLDSGDSAITPPEERESRSVPRKILTLVSGLMDLMAEGLDPGVKKQWRNYDLIVVGAGPAGTSAAICAASEGVDTLIVETGQVEIDSQIIESSHNCTANARGFDLGSESELDNLRAQDFLLDIQPGLAVTGIRSESGYRRVDTNQGWIGAKSLILAPGLRRRRLNVPGEKEFIGAGVHSCANCEGPVYAGKDLVVIGAGNSGIEQALYLVNFANSVTVVERSSRASCTRELYQKAKANPNITFKFNRIVREFRDDQVFISVLVEDAKTGKIEDLSSAAAFMAIGFEPATGVFRSSVDIDQSGFISTNRSMQTKLPGVFAAGHARSRRVRSPEEAANDGYKAAMSVRNYLENAKR